jgi:hypothetical protein
MKIIHKLRLLGKVKDMIILIFLLRFTEKRILRNFKRLGVDIGNNSGKHNDCKNDKRNQSK